MALMGGLTVDNHAQTAAELGDFTSQMLDTMRSVPSENNKQLAQAMEITRLSKEFWDNESKHGQGSDYMVGLVTTQQDTSQ